MKYIYILVIGVICISLTGCASTKIVKEAGDNKMLNILFVTCKKPHALKQDCSSFSGAKRKIKIKGHELKIAATEDGKTILIMEAHPIKNAWTTTWPVTDYTSQSSRDSFYTVKFDLEEHGINILETQAIGAMYSVYGYFVTLDSDGYSVLKEYSIE